MLLGNLLCYSKDLIPMYSAKEIYDEVELICVEEPKLIADAYIFLVENLIYGQSLFGCPIPFGTNVSKIYRFL